MKDHVSIENCPEFETSVQFDYPLEQLPPDVRESVELYAKQIIHLKLVETIRRLLLLLEGERHPEITLQALLYSVGVNSLDAKGTLTAVANTLNISKQRFQYQTKTVGNRMMRKIKQVTKNPLNPFNDV
jgi:hypothetical protein